MAAELIAQWTDHGLPLNVSVKFERYEDTGCALTVTTDHPRALPLTVFLSDPAMAFLISRLDMAYPSNTRRDILLAAECDARRAEDEAELRW